jgi:hypothetical protein
VYNGYRKRNSENGEVIAVNSNLNITDIGSRNKERTKQYIQDHFSFFMICSVIILGALVWKGINHFSILPKNGNYSKESPAVSGPPEVKATSALNLQRVSIGGKIRVSHLMAIKTPDSRENWKFHVFANPSAGIYVAVRKRGPTYDGLVQLADGTLWGNLDHSTLMQAELPVQFKKEQYQQRKGAPQPSELQDFFSQIASQFHCFQKGSMGESQIKRPRE